MKRVMSSKDTYISTQNYKGTRDFYPDEMDFRRWMFGKMRDAVEAFGYREYGGPLLESFDLYAAKTGQEIVEKQLYWFMDRGERKVAIRPEMTPTLARMVSAKLGELPKPIRLYSIPNLWRYERPQRGRLREHWQLNVDVMGGDRVYADAEILRVALAIMDSFGGREQVEIRVNHRGLMDHFIEKVLGISGQQGIHVIKAVDARSKLGEEKYQTWLSEIGLGSDQSKKLEGLLQSSFDEIKKAYPCEGVEELGRLLDILGDDYKSGTILFDPTITRGLDYYTSTVFEMFDKAPDNNRAMFGGGRYDNLIGLFGKESLSGVGLGMGDVTLRNFLETHGLMPDLGAPLDVYVTVPSDDLFEKCLDISNSIRAKGLNVATALSSDKFAKQLKQAGKLRASFVVILGEDELAKGEVGIKNFKTGNQGSIPMNQVSDWLIKNINA